MRSLFVLLICILTACSKISSADFMGETKGDKSPLVGGSVIDNEDLSAGLKGVDANNNGIRDDIDRLIALRYSITPEMKKASEQNSRSLQQIMDATTKSQAILAGNENSRAASCFYKNFPKTTSVEKKFRIKAGKEIEALTANTRERFEAYMKANSLMGGTVFKQPEEPVCD
jgi:hypothetical protein